jgi:hypothetical protein
MKCFIQRRVFRAHIYIFRGDGQTAEADENIIRDEIEKIK